MSVQVFSPAEMFHDINGQPLDDGNIWIGQPNLDPQSNPISVFFDEALTIPATQPIRTRNGYPANAGAQTQVFVAQDTFSISIRNKNSSVIRAFTAAHTSSDLESRLANASDPAKGDALLGVKLDATGTVGRTQHDKNAEQVSPEDWGAVGDGSIDDTVAMTAALAHVCSNGGRLAFTSGKRYRCGLINATVEAGKSVVIEGNGATFLSTNTGTTRSLFFLGKAGARIHVANLTVDHVTPPNWLDGNGTAETGALTFNPFNYAGGQYFDEVVTENVTIASAWWAGIRPYLCRVFRAENCKVKNARGTGIFGGVLEHVYLNSNEVLNTSDDCIFFGATVLVPAISFTAEQNIVGQNGSKGIGAAGFKRISIDGNIVFDTSAFAIVAFSGLEASDTWGPINQVSITDNVIDKVRGSINNVAGTKSGIYIRGDATRQPLLVSIDGNNVRDIDEFCVRVDTAKKLLITSNLLDGDSCVLVGGDSLALATDEMLLTDNVMVCTDSNGVSLFDVGRFSIENNHIRGFTVTPVFGKRCSNGYVPYNILEGTGDYSFTSANLNTNCIFGGITYTVSAYVGGISQADGTNPIIMRRHAEQARNSAFANEMELIGDVAIIGAISAASQSIMNLGTIPQPLVTQNIPVSCYNGSTYTIANLQIRNNSNGLCVLYGAPTNTTLVSISARYKLL